MNSVRNVGDAIAYEIVRQSECLDRGEAIVLHTRLWDPEKRVTMPMRGKFSGPCVPDPSVARIVVTDDWLKDIRRRLPEMPGRKAERFSKEYGLTPEEASNMSQEREISEFFEEAARQGIPPRKAASWITTHLMPALRDRDAAITETPITPGRFARLLAILETGVINAHAAKEVLLQLLASDRSPDEIVEEGKYRQVSDNSELEAIVDTILADHPSDVDDFRGGNAKVMGFLMGLAMKASGGKANPRLLKEIFTKRLG